MPSADVDVPEVSGDVSAPSASGDVSLPGVSGDVTLPSASGDVSMPSVSGDVSLPRVSGDVSLPSASGDVSLPGASGDVSLPAVSGDVSALSAAVDVDVPSASGDLSGECFASPPPPVFVTPFNVFTFLCKRGTSVFFFCAFLFGNTRAFKRENRQLLSCVQNAPCCRSLDSFCLGSLGGVDAVGGPSGEIDMKLGSADPALCMI